ncbi:MAG TPA: DUF2934 domain-containing protein [Chthoniobacteraceae bacterium]
MAKKSNPIPKAEAAPAIPASPASAKAKATVPAPGVNGDGKRAAKAPAKKIAAQKTKTPPPKAPMRKVTPSAAKPKTRKAKPIKQEDIALRAYFISEKRRREGLPGDARQDWIEAERELKEGR